MGKKLNTLKSAVKSTAKAGKQVVGALKGAAQSDIVRNAGKTADKWLLEDSSGNFDGWLVGGERKRRSKRRKR